MLLKNLAVRIMFLRRITCFLCSRGSKKKYQSHCKVCNQHTSSHLNCNFLSFNGKSICNTRKSYGLFNVAFQLLLFCQYFIRFTDDIEKKTAGFTKIRDQPCKISSTCIQMIKSLSSTLLTVKS